MHWSIEISSSRKEVLKISVHNQTDPERRPTIAHGIETPFFASDHNVSNGFTLLPSFWGKLYPSVAI
jgi:hypothetical protein